MKMKTFDNAAAAIAFHEKAFGAMEVMRLRSSIGRRLMHAEITINGVFLMDGFSECRNTAKENAMPTGVSGATSITLHFVAGP